MQVKAVIVAFSLSLIFLVQPAVAQVSTNVAEPKKNSRKTEQNSFGQLAISLFGKAVQAVQNRERNDKMAHILTTRSVASIAAKRSKVSPTIEFFKNALTQKPSNIEKGQNNASAY